jgi:metal-responsive CopG/Arc/MetJ family transcriptional regulator
MKTAISIPDQIFESADKLANRLGTSRSQLYTQAIRDYLEGHQGDKVTQKLNEVYGQEDSQLEAGLKELQKRSLAKDEW